MILFFDTETTGKADFKRPSDHPCQPHLVQFAAVACDNDGKILHKVKVLVKPEMWEIPPEASAIHGVTQEHACKYGIWGGVALLMFNQLCMNAKLLVAFNNDFDVLVMEKLASEIGKMTRTSALDQFDVMKAMTPVCQIPSPYREGEFKWPKLTEAYQHAFKKGFDAHDALADVMATKELYFWLRDQKPNL